jgi:hypothetical protein
MDGDSEVIAEAAWNAGQDALRAALLADQKKAPSDVSQAEWDELRGLVMVEHEHCESRNECAICDESLVSSAVKEIKRHRALLADRPDVAIAMRLCDASAPTKYEREEIKRTLESLAAKVAERDAVLKLIASRGVKPRQRPLGNDPAFGCTTCSHWWDEGEEEHHSPDCAYIVARDALEAYRAAHPVPSAN